MEPFFNVLVHLGIEGPDLISGLECASHHFLWNVGTEGVGAHATTGVSDVWREFFTGDVLKEFRRLFGNAEEVLGYPSYQ